MKKCLLSSPDSTHDAFAVIHGHEQSRETFESLYLQVLSSGLNKAELHFLVSVLMMEISGLFTAVHFAFIFCSLVMILLFKTALKYSAEVLSIVLKCTKARLCPMEKIPVLDMLVQEEVTVLLAVSSMFRDQQYRLNEASLKRITHKARLCIGWLTKRWDQRLSGT